VLTLSPIAFLRMMGAMRGGAWALAFVHRWRPARYRGATLGDANAASRRTRRRFGGYEPDDWHAGAERSALGAPLRPVRHQPTASTSSCTTCAAGERSADRGPVVLVHGRRPRAQPLYGAPLQTTIADALLQRGYDVLGRGLAREHRRPAAALDARPGRRV